MRVESFVPTASSAPVNESPKGPQAPDLSDDLWQNIFTLNTPADLVSAAGVNRRWRHLAEAKWVSRKVLHNASALPEPVPAAWPDQPAVMRWAAKVRVEAFYERHAADGPTCLRHTQPDFDSDLKRHLALSPNDRWLGVASVQFAPKWDIIDLENLTRPRLHLVDPPRGITDIAFAPNESSVAFLCATGLVRHYGLTGGRTLPLCEVRHRCPVEVGAYSSNSAYFASADERSVFVQSLTNATKSTIAYSLPKQTNLEKIAFANNDSFLVLQDHYSVTLIDLALPAAFAAPQTHTVGHSYPHHATLIGTRLQVVAWTDDGTTEYFDGINALYDEQGRRPLTLEGRSDWDTGAQVSSDMTWIVKPGEEVPASNRCTSTLLFNVRQKAHEHNGLEPVELHHAPRPYTHALFAHRTSSLLLVSEFDGREPCDALYLYDLNHLEREPWSGGLGYALNETVVSSDGRRAFAISNKGGVLLWALPPPTA